MKPVIHPLRIVMHPIDAHTAHDLARRVAGCTVLLAENWPADAVGFDGPWPDIVAQPMAARFASGWRPVLLGTTQAD